MANEILKDEILKEEELDQVAGGTVVETASDTQLLRDIGVEGIKGYGNYATEHRFDEISGYAKEAWSAVGIDFTGVKDGNNIYKLDGKEITREAAYKHAMKLKGVNLPLSRYGFKTK